MQKNQSSKKQAEIRNMSHLLQTFLSWDACCVCSCLVFLVFLVLRGSQKEADEERGHPGAGIPLQINSTRSYSMTRGPCTLVSGGLRRPYKAVSAVLREPQTPTRPAFSSRRCAMMQQSRGSRGKRWLRRPSVHGPRMVP